MPSCPSCPGAQVDYDSTTGSSYCTLCGAVCFLVCVMIDVVQVLEESTITAEIGFVESGDGSSRMVGQFISQDRG